VKTLTATAAVSYELDFWGRNFENARAANKSLAASEFDRETVALTTVSGVANSYFRLLSLRDRLRVSRLNVDNAAKLLALTQKQFDAGVVSRLPACAVRST
jgi:outer membrane protein TolC